MYKTVSGASISVGSSDLVIGTDHIPLPSGNGNGNGTASSGVEGFTSTGSGRMVAKGMRWWGMLVLAVMVLGCTLVGEKS